MNTSVMLAAEGEKAIEGLYATKLFIDECEQRFSRFLPASEVSELNRSAGDWLTISADLMDMLRLSLKYYKETEGIFDPAILSDLKQAGYDRSMDEIRAHGVAVVTHAAKQTSRPAFDEISLDLAGSRVRLPDGLEIDLGGIAKGWIVEKAAYLLRGYAEICAVSAGGDILFIGQPLDGTDWDVYLEDPRNPTQTLAQLHIPSGAVATSSVMKRTWRQGDKMRHHLIDPRTGEPANTAWLSVSVISPDVITAEVYAKAILIGGNPDVQLLLPARQDLTFIAVDSQGNLLGSPNYKDYIYELTSDTFLSIETTR
ncbi:MAG TPA: FAD:protein FMN transferase [Anaerolineales bacterium]|nr:FAD:protein FMN transferase [Anaerolineales bacterium]